MNVIEQIRASLGDARLVAVSKYMPDSRIQELYDMGQREFGENKIQDMRRKMELFSDLDIAWHFIGTLQSNKINHMIAARPSLWQSCNSLELAVAVNKRLDYTLDTLLEVNIADESTKTGLAQEKAAEIYTAICETCPNLNLIGIMTIGAHSSDESVVRDSFIATHELFAELKRKFEARICSMGMSGDYKIAIECGSNMVRIGSALH